MEIFQNVLKRAQEEGKLDPRMIPWERPKVNGKRVRRPIPYDKLQLPPQLLAFSESVVYDLQKIIENIRLLAETHSMQIVGFTSPIQHQGTSSLTALLSLLMAAREKVGYERSQAHGDTGAGKAKARQLGLLLMDTQFRHPSLQRKFGIPKGGGLIEILENQIAFNNAVSSIPDSSLRLIKTGASKNFHLTQNHLIKFRSILQYLKTKVEFIFLDIPALLPYSEGIALSKLCDGVVLVVGAGELRWEVVQEARKLLERANVNILGGILNKREYFIPSWAYRSI